MARGKYSDRPQPPFWLTVLFDLIEWTPGRQSEILVVLEPFIGPKIIVSGCPTVTSVSSLKPMLYMFKVSDFGFKVTSKSVRKLADQEFHFVVELRLGRIEARNSVKKNEMRPVALMQGM